MKNPRMQAWLTRPDGLGTKLRTARAGLSMRDLATALGGQWTSSKVSKIETGQQLPTEREVDQWATATKATSSQRKEWQRLLQEALSMRSTFWRRTSTRDQSGAAVNQLESVAALTRVVQPNTIPELLQTEQYARAVGAPTKTPDELDTAVVDLLQRQEILRDGLKRFEFLIGEAALRTIRGTPAVMAEQLDRLISAGSLSNVTIAVVPLATPLTSPPIASPYVLYDRDEAVTDDGVEDHRYSGPAVELLRQLADEVWAEAAKERRARKLILDALHALPDT